MVVIMTTTRCVFCSIIQGNIPANVVGESDDVIAVEDINPRAPIHYLIIPKKHIVDMASINEGDFGIIGEMGRMVRDLAKNLPQPASFNIVSNNGAASGQSVFHVHWHFLAGKNVYEEGLRL
jgi:histidine triad (HIT) family protein